MNRTVWIVRLAGLALVLLLTLLMLNLYTKLRRMSEAQSRPPAASPRTTS